VFPTLNTHTSSVLFFEFCVLLHRRNRPPPAFARGALFARLKDYVLTTLKNEKRTFQPLDLASRLLKPFEPINWEPSKECFPRLHPLCRSTKALEKAGSAYNSLSRLASGEICFRSLSVNRGETSSTSRLKTTAVVYSPAPIGCRRPVQCHQDVKLACRVAAHRRGRADN